jgi:hypothetical protein
MEVLAESSGTNQQAFRGAGTRAPFFIALHPTVKGLVVASVRLMRHAEQDALDYTGRDDETAFLSTKSCEFGDRSASPLFGRMFGGNEKRLQLKLH